MLLYGLHGDVSPANAREPDGRERALENLF